MAWHLEAVGSEGQRGTGDPKTMDLAALLYKKVAETWNADEFSKFEFPRLVKEDWPTIYKIKYNMADLLYFREKWAECGPAFDAVVQEDPKAPEAAEAAYAAVLCYQNIYLAQHAKGSDKKGTGNLPGVGKDIKAGLRRQVPAEGHDRRPEGDGSVLQPVRLLHPPRQGRRRRAEAARRGQVRPLPPLLRGAALGRGGRLLQGHRVSTTRTTTRRSTRRSSTSRASTSSRSTGSPNRNSCIDDMIADVPKFIDLFCTGDKMAEERGDLHAAHEGAVRHPAPPGAADRRGRRTRAATTRSSSSRRAARRTSTSGRSTAPRRSGTTSRRSARSSTRSSRTPRAPSRRATSSRARSARAWCCSTRTYRMEKSELAKDAMFKIGGNYQAIAVYDQASDWYERYAKENPHRKDADKALSDAIVLRLGLGQEDIAVADVKQYQEGLRQLELHRDRADRLRHRRPLRRQGRLGERAQGALRRDGDARQGAAGHPGAGARARSRARSCTSRPRRRRQGRVRQGPQALGRRQRGPGEDQRRLQVRGRGPARSPARQGARRGRRGHVLRRPRTRSTRRSMRSRSPSTRARARRTTSRSTWTRR